MTGEANISLAISEPEAGSDMAGLTSTAELINNEHEEVYIVNGSKKWITGGHWAEYFLVAARTDTDAGMLGISLFLVDRTFPGIEVIHTPAPPRHPVEYLLHIIDGLY